MNRTDEWAIFMVAARLAQASDDRDAAAYRACLADVICIDHAGETAIVAADYVSDAMTRLSETLWTHHKLVNPVIEVHRDGQGAAANIDVVVTVCVGEARRPRLIVRGGRYGLGFVRTGPRWRIIRRILAARYSYEQPTGGIF